MRGPVVVRDQGTVLRFGFDDLLRYHGPRFPGGVAHGFTAMERALPLLAADGIPERREIALTTAFPGPGARDGVELVTRAVTEGRYTVDPALAASERGPTLERYVFCFSHGERSVTVAIRDGFVTDEFIALSRAPDRTATQDAHLSVLKQEMADRLLAVPADQVYDVLDS